MKMKKGSLILLAFTIAFCIALFVTVILSALEVGNSGDIYLISEAVALAIAFVAILIINHIYNKHVIKPFDKLCDGLKEVANGNFSVEIHEEKKHSKNVENIYDNFNKMTAELRSAELMKVDFFSDVSHEFKAPLSAINYSTALLKSGSLSDEERQYVEAIENATHKLNNMVSNILKLNRIEHNNISLHTETFGICEQLEGCLIDFECDMETKQLNLITNFDNEIQITSDKELLQIVWTNIISNAVKFSNIRGTITVNILRKDDRIVVEVKDNGIGMDEHTCAHIFDKFYQADKARITEGNGLGLSLVKQIAQMLMLEIQVSSAPQKGTTFTVIIKP